MTSVHRHRQYLSLLSMLVALTACQSLSKLDRLRFRSDSERQEDAQLAAADGQSRDAGPRAPRKEAAADDAATTARCDVADGGACDPVRQCGCELGKHCQVVGDGQQAKCSAIGTGVAWGACTGSSRCPMGQTCDRGSCRPYCEKDQDCEDGACEPVAGPDGELSERYRVCWKHCESSSECAQSTSCRQVRTPRGRMGMFCAAPADPCPSVEDGECDEARGTGACAEGTDAKDCCDRPDGADCDPVEQCGCPGDATCFLDPDTNLGVCTLPIKGQRMRGEHCNSATDCRRGLVCLSGTLDVCTSYCRESSDCAEGRSCFRSDANEIGFCMDPCLRAEAQSTCADGLVCASLSVPRGDFCWKPVNCAMLRRDGVCQESTGFCIKGTDPEDCCDITGGNACNLFEQCGCEAEPNTSCYVINDGSYQCRVGGSRKLGEGCDSDNPCGGGGMCADKICRAFCEHDGVGCGRNGLCMPIHGTNTAESTTLPFGACYERCDFVQNDCPNGSLCAKVTQELHYCSIPMEPCPAGLIGNSVCDDTRPEGSRICAMGTDPDCDMP